MRPAQEQASKPSRFQGGLGMMLGVPIGGFGDNVEVAAGISGNSTSVSVAVRSAPVSS